MKLLNSLKFKIMLVLLSVSLIPLLGLAIFQLSHFNTVVTENIKQQEVETASSTASSIDSWILSKVSQLTEIIKVHPEFKNMNKEQIVSIIKYINETDAEIETSVVVDKNGDSLTGDNLRRDINDRDYFIKIKETRAPAISDILVSKATGNKIIAIAVPIFDDNYSFVGGIISIVNIKALETNIGKVKVGSTGYAYLLSSKGDYIFHHELNRVGKNYKLYAKNQAKEQVFSEGILVKKDGFIEYPDDDGTEKIGAFATIAKTGWKVVVSAPTKEVYAEVNKSQRVTAILILVTVILIIFISIFFAGFIAKPIELVAKYLNVLANADFTQQIPEKFIKRKDEIGILAKSLEVMSNSIKSLIRDVITEANRVKENILISAHNLVELTSQVEDVSATTEEMSAGMEQTAASAQEMNATSLEIESAVQSIATKAQDGSEIVEEIGKRAQDLKENAVASQNTAHEIRNNIGADVRAAIEQSKAVEKINLLTESILQITSQTNLLALNAAIEAARAGEAGRGFAVVAEEIRKLAEDSKVTVNEIQDVTKLVVDSVQNLTQSSEKALDFIDTAVIADYKALVNTGEQYYKDSEAVEELVSDFSATSEELLASMQSMLKAINEVTISNNEGALGTQNIAERSSSVMQKANKVAELMKATEQSSEKLAQIVSKFKI